MRRWIVVALLAAVAIAGGSLYATGKLAIPESAAQWFAQPEAKSRPVPLPAVTVVKVETGRFVETVLVTGSLVAREEIVVAPELSGQRVIELLADIGDQVQRGQVLAKLVTSNLDAQLAQNAATRARALAARARAKSEVVRAEAQKQEADSALSRAAKLKRSGNLAQSVYEQRVAAARTAAAQLAAAKDGVEVAHAEIDQADAQRRELVWRRERAAVNAPASGIVSRRNAQVGAMASSEPMFHIIRDGEIELAGELAAEQLAKVRAGQPVRLRIADQESVTGSVRLISPEINATTRLGQVRIFLGKDKRLRIGTFARGEIETARGAGLSLPASAVMYGSDGAYVLAVAGDTARQKAVKVGLMADDRIEITAGLDVGETVIAKAGTFLRDGDKVRPVMATTTQVSGVN